MSILEKRLPGNPADVDPELGDAERRQMVVAVDEAGHQHSAGEVHCPGIRPAPGLDILGGPDKDNLIAPDGDGFRLGIGRIHGVNQAALVNPIGLPTAPTNIPATPFARRVSRFPARRWWPRFPRSPEPAEMTSKSPTADVTTSRGTFSTVAATAVFSSVGSGTTAPGRGLTLDFGTLTNANTTNAATETLVVTYRAVVLNSTNNNRGNQRNNAVEWRWQDDFGPQAVQDSAPNVQLVEPTLVVFKEASPVTGQAGDTITFTIEVRQAGVSNADAFDVELSDLIPGDMTYVAGSLLHTGGVAPTVLSESGGTVTAVWNTFPDTNSSFLRFAVTLDSSVVPGQVLTNQALVLYTSLPGDVTTAQSTHNTLSTERTGDITDPGGTANDYRAADPADVTVVDPDILGKTIVATSEFLTGGTNVSIGEIVRYRLQATLIEGTNTAYQFVDRLPAGLSFIDPAQVRISFISDSPIGSAADLAGANGGPIPPTFVMPASRVTVVGQQITFDFGTLVDTDLDAGQESVVLEFNALVLNTADTNDGDVKSNVFDLMTGGELVDQSPFVDVTIVEPSITKLDKTILGPLPTDAGDPVTYRLTLSNTGAGPAWNVRVVDVLDPAYYTLLLPPTATTTCVGGVIVDRSVGTTVDIEFGCMDVGMSAEIIYTAVLKTAVEPSQVLVNTASLTYTSLTGPNGTLVNPTGSSTPGTSGSSTGERNGSGGVNDYTDTDSQSIVLQSPTFAKSLTATNQSHTTGLDVAIGEIVTYTAVITVPEGTLSGTRMVDTPEPGLAIVDVVSIVPSNAAVLATSIGTFDDVRDSANATLPVSGNTVTLNFGTLTNTDTDNGVAETLTVIYRAVVLNTVANSRGLPLVNRAEWTWSQGTLTDAAEPVTIVEPALSISKANGDPVIGDAGDVITFAILVQHHLESNADAFDVSLTDLINSLAGANKMTFVPGSVAVVNAGGAALHPGFPDETGGDLALEWNLFPLGATSTVTFAVTLDTTVTPGDILTNTADLA